MLFFNYVLFSPLVATKKMLFIVLVLVIVIGKRLSKGCENKKDYDYEHRFAEHEHE
jgi:hypothetical protein